MAKNSNKTTQTEESVYDFLEKVPDQNKRDDCKVIIEMMKKVTGLPPKMWGPSIIGFGTYHYKYESGREGDMLKIGFSPRKQNITLYIMPGFDRYDDIMKTLGKHRIGKSCLYIKGLSDVNKVQLLSLIEESYSYMTTKYG
jgi:hypothetical protein